MWLCVRQSSPIAAASAYKLTFHYSQLSLTVTYVARLAAFGALRPEVTGGVAIAKGGVDMALLE